MADFLHYVFEHVSDGQLCHQAFIIFCRLRILCANRYGQCTEVDLKPLQWKPSHELLALIQSYFETSDKHKTLGPFMYMCLANPENQTQGAVVLQHLLSSEKDVVEHVKGFIKRLKQENKVKLLEIQMSALRLEPNAVALSKKLVQFWTKREVALVGDPFLKFLAEGIRYALENTSQLVFLECIKSFLPLLDTSGWKDLQFMSGEHFRQMDERVEAEFQTKNYAIEFGQQFGLQLLRNERMAD